MTIICEECGKIYYISAEKIARISEDRFRTKCRTCGHIIQVSKQEIAGRLSPETPEMESESTMEIPDSHPRAETPDYQDEAPPAALPSRARPSKPGFFTLGLRSKMLFLFLLVPIFLMAASGHFFQTQLDNLSDDINYKSMEVIRQLGEENIANIAKAVAIQAQVYLESHPVLKEDNFNFDSEFQPIAIQKVGDTGYTFLLEMAEENKDWRVWAHPNPILIGIEVDQILMEVLGDSAPAFFDILERAKGGYESSGYYSWREENGTFRDKYMYVAPIKGTSYAICSTTYIDEFTARIRDMQAHTQAVSSRIRQNNLYTLGGTLLIIGLIIIIYGHRLTSRIRSLTEATNRISVGELDTEIEVKSKDEIGRLAEAIARMQDSLRLSIERLRRRR